MPAGHRDFSPFCDNYSVLKNSSVFAEKKLLKIPYTGKYRRKNSYITIISLLFLKNFKTVFKTDRILIIGRISAQNSAKTSHINMTNTCQPLRKCHHDIYYSASGSNGLAVTD
jgi:hypothetical protein